MSVHPISKTFPALLDEQANRYGDREAVVGSGQRLTYAQLRVEVMRVARGLAALGMRHGDHVGILMSNRPEWIISFLAILQVGGVVVALNTWATPREFEYSLQHADVRILISVERLRNQVYRDVVEQVRDKLPLLKHAVWFEGEEVNREGDYSWRDWDMLGKDVAQREVERRGQQVAGDDIAFLLYSSGSTALPKGILLGHQASIENGWNIGERQHITEADRVWLVVSLFWSFGSVNAATNLFTHGGCLVLQERFDAGEALALIEAERCSVFYGTPNMAHAMQEHPERGTRDLSSLRTGAAIGTPEQLLRIVNLGVHKVCNVYGQTETYGNCAVIDADEPLEVRLKSVGKPLPGVTVRICDPDNGKEVPVGEFGEIRVKGYVFHGYYKSDEQTRKVFDGDGFLCSGDLGMTDGSGFLFYRGRLNETVKSGGINVAPAEVEEVLMRHPMVHTAFVVGLPDPVLDQILGAVIIARPGPRPGNEELLAFCRRELAAYKVPARFHFLTDNELPLTTTGKVQKSRLPELFMEQKTTV